MKPSLRNWLKISLLASALVLGCRHARHSCDCCFPCPPASAVALAPVAPADAGQQTVTPVAHNTAPQFQEVKKVDPNSASKKEDPGQGPILITVEAPESTGTSQSSRTGTMEITAAQAEAMGIKPGYTPGALFVPVPATNSTTQTTSPGGAGPTESREPPQTSVPEKEQK